jgi:hypothetical protein
MTEKTFRLIDLFIKASGPLLVLAGIVIGLDQYNTNLEEDRITQAARYKNILTQAKIDARKPFLEAQLSLYLDVTNITAGIAQSLDEDAIDRFWQLYKGSLVLVENKAVEQAMAEFGKILREESLTDDKRKNLLGLKAIEIAKACRESVKTSWDVALEPI